MASNSDLGESQKDYMIITTWKKYEIGKVYNQDTTDGMTNRNEEVLTYAFKVIAERTMGEYLDYCQIHVPGTERSRFVTYRYYYEILTD